MLNETKTFPFQNFEYKEDHAIIIDSDGRQQRW